MGRTVARTEMEGMVVSVHQDSVLLDDESVKLDADVAVEVKPKEKDNEEKSPEYYDELSQAIDDSIANEQLLLEDINRVEILLLEDIKYGEETEQRVSELQEELKQSGRLALEKKKIRK